MIVPPFWEELLSAMSGGAAVKWLMRHGQGDIAVCTTRIVRDGRGLPWNERIAIHPLADGRIHMKRVRADENR